VQRFSRLCIVHHRNIKSTWTLELTALVWLIHDLRMTSCGSLHDVQVHWYISFPLPGHDLQIHIAVEEMLIAYVPIQPTAGSVLLHVKKNQSYSCSFHMRHSFDTFFDGHLNFKLKIMEVRENCKHVKNCCFKNQHNYYTEFFPSVYHLVISR
jgi:hypothetical protein